ncbi:MAG: HAD-IIIC family phosphatase, partial [Ferrovibrio sp.]
LGQQNVANQITSAIAAVGNCAPGLLVIHSSLLHFRLPGSVGKRDFQRALRNLLRAGYTLALPSFTFGFCKGIAYNHMTSRSETGQLADWALELAEFRRTPHPIYSFAAAGPLLKELTSAANSTTFGPDSIFASFIALNARIVMLGAPWESCTIFHHAEELASVPYRYFKTFAGEADFGSGCAAVTAKMFVRDLDLAVENDFVPLIQSLKQGEKFSSTELWHASIEAADASDIIRLATQMLAENPWALAKDSRLKKRQHEWRIGKQKNPSIKIALAGSANLALLKQALNAELSQAIPDRNIELYSPDFGQMLAELVSADSGLSTFGASVTILTDRLEDLLGRHSLVGVDEGMAIEAVERYCDGIEGFRARAGGWIVVHRFPMSTRSALGAADRAAGSGNRALLDACNHILDKRLASLNSIRLLDADDLLSPSGSEIDHRLWFIGRFPYSLAHTNRLARLLSGVVLSALGRTARLIVLDLDNTLWGGVLGEDGISGLQLGGDYPGNAFSEFQTVIRNFGQLGIALAICSKNDEDHALEAMRSMPGMVLRDTDIVAHRIGWQPKWQSVADICEELGLGLGSVLFVDDNPVEREQIRQFLPDVKILDLPQDPALYVDAILNTPWLQRLEVTAEDKKRTQSYRARAEIAELQRTAVDKDRFLASLEQKLYCQKLSDTNIARAAQLMQKTNQFNTTTRRHDALALQALQQQGADIVVLGAEDRFSAKENIGVLVVKWDVDSEWAEVDSYLLSCRVLGRGLETGILQWLARYALNRGAKELIGRVIETERNQPARNVYKDAGFSAAPAQGEWRMPLQSPAPALPAWLTVFDEFAKETR